MQYNRWKQQVIYFESMENKTRTSSERKDLHRVKKEVGERHDHQHV